MKIWLMTGLGLLAGIVCAPSLYAQVAVPPAAGAAGAAGAPAAPASNLWSFFCLTPEQSARCKEKLCNSPLGEMLKSMAKPMAMMSGGLVAGKCGTPTAEDLKKLKDEGKEGGAEDTAAKIKKDEAEAAARRQAVRYLGTVDCNYWPEASQALIDSLRGDRNECVRYEAALALGRGCCCNKKTMEALKHSANGDKKDGFPAECSDRVRSTASAALAHCLSVFSEVTENGTIKEKEGPRKEGDQGAPGQVSMFRQQGPRNQGILGIFAGASAASPSPVMDARNAAVAFAPMNSGPMASGPVYQPMVPPPAFVSQNNAKSQIVQTGYTQSSRMPSSPTPASAAPVSTRGWIVLENATPSTNPAPARSSETSMQSPGLSIQLLPVPNSGTPR